MWTLNLRGIAKKHLKLIKFLTLFLFMVGVAAASFSTWHELVFPNQMTKWRDTDGLWLWKDRAFSGSVFVNTQYYSAADEYIHDTPDVGTQVTISLYSSSKSPSPKLGYIAAIGQTDRWLQSCRATSMPADAGPVLQHVNDTDLPPGLTDEIPKDSSPVTYYELLTASIECEGTASNIWSVSGESHTLKVPILSIRNIGHDKPPGSTSACVQSYLTYSNGADVKYSDPKPNFVADTTDNQLGWRDCSDFSADLQIVTLESVSARLSDIKEEARIKRSDFFAAAFLGVLGALSIEVILSLFDVWQTRTELAIPPSPPPSPQPSPAPPRPADDPDEQEDRDQLPLF